MGEHEAKSVRLGNIGPETEFVLNRFSFPLPPLLKSARTQICDIAYDTPPTISEEMPVRSVWEMMTANGIQTVPVIGDSGRLIGLVTEGDIAELDLRQVYSHKGVETNIENLLTTLSGRLLSGTRSNVSGVISIAQSKQDFQKYTGIIIAPWSEDYQAAAMESSASCVILCHAHNAKASAGTTPVIATALDLYRAAVLTPQSTPVSKIMTTEGLVTFSLYDYLDDVREKLLSSRFRCYPIINDEGFVAGTLSRTHLISPSKKRVILVDHNEKQQSIAGIEQAEILEIIDHHRLGDVQTGKPMFFRNEPVGSTTTIIASMFQENGQTPSKELAGLMLAGILSDTVLFKSPTCTYKDKRIAKYLAEAADVDSMELGRELFDAIDKQLSQQSTEKLFFYDFKEYNLGGVKIGVGQVTCLSAEILKSRGEQLKAFMRKLLTDERFEVLLFMVTDIEREGTLFYHCETEPDLLEKAFNIELADAEFFIKGMMSRKKQVIPALSNYLL